MDNDIPWGRVCNHPFVQGLHRIITIVAAPLALAMLYWSASTFDGMRFEVRELRTTVTLKVRELELEDARIARRLDRLEGWSR